MLTDPCVHLQMIDGHARLLGVMRQPLRMRIEGRGFVVGVKFRPGGFQPFLGGSVAGLTDCAVPARQVFPTADECAAVLGCAIDGCSGDAGAHAAIIGPCLDAMLGAHIAARDPIAEEMGRLVTHVATHGCVRRVADLVAVSGRSERTLQRLFLRYVGVSPSWVIRWHRLEAAARQLTERPRALASVVAQTSGYADQAHLIRDFRTTIGVTPGAYVQGRG